jgi:DNA repair photolyase
LRWQEQTTEAVARRQLPGYRDAAAVRTFPAVRLRNTRFYEVRAKSALNRVPGSRTPFRWTINPFRGCSHACHYCYARTSHEFLGFDAGEGFDREIVVKVNIADVLRAELRRPGWGHELVALGTNTDPYQWAEGRYRLMRGIWEALRDHANPASILTKSPLVLRDIDLIRQLSERASFTAYLSIPTLDETSWRQTEPRTPKPSARLEALRRLAASGIPVGVVIAPLLPGINDDPAQIKSIVDTALSAGAESIDALPLHLRGSTKQVFMSWLLGARPDLVGHYEELFGNGSEMDGAEQRRLVGLVQPRGRTWDERVRELRQSAVREAPPCRSPGSQQTLF